MPIYEYQCKDCNERHEIIQSISETPLTHCPKCGGAMKKLISSPAIQFKGSGFYKTDYAGSGTKPETRNQKPEETKSEKSESTKSETSKSETSTKSET